MEYTRAIELLRHFDKNLKKGYHATTLEVSVLHQSLALFCAFTTIITTIGCCIAVEMFCKVHSLSSGKVECTFVPHAMLSRLT